MVPILKHFSSPLRVSLPPVACRILFSWGGQLRFGAQRTLGQSDDIFLMAPGTCPPRKMFELWFLEMAFPQFEDSFEQNLKVSNRIWQSIFQPKYISLSKSKQQ